LSFVLAIRHRSFRWIACRLVPVPNPRKRAAIGVVLLVLTGCGASSSAAGDRLVQGQGFSFRAPADWALERRGSEVQAGRGTDLISVTRYPLLRRFRPQAWAKVVPELDRAAATVARQQSGTAADSRTVTVGGRQARRYDVLYERDSKKLTERITFVLREKTEYLLLCRYERGGSTDACDRLLSSFKLAAA
jgi:hypothetical protein